MSNQIKSENITHALKYKTLRITANLLKRNFMIYCLALLLFSPMISIRFKLLIYETWTYQSSKAIVNIIRLNSDRVSKRLPVCFGF